MKNDWLYPLRRFHGMLYEKELEKKKLKELYKKLHLVDERTIFFVLSPTHGNLGDHAIAIATTNMLDELKINYVEVTIYELSLLKKFNKLKVLDKHLILVNGGGNLGMLWPDIEALFRKLIQVNTHSSIICLPNTIYYEKTPAGTRDMELSRKIYNAHSHLTLCARERISYELMKSLYKNVYLIPDMALSLNECEKQTNRNGCILCLRTDKEKTLTDLDEDTIYQQVYALFGDNVKETDMNIGTSVSIDMRTNALNQKYKEFRSAKLVVTDRLHGMIFSAITGTPCIVINSKSPKVKGCYEWIKSLQYIKFAESVDQIESLYNEIPQDDNIYDNSNLQPYYESLKDILRTMEKKE